MKINGLTDAFGFFYGIAAGHQFQQIRIFAHPISAPARTMDTAGCNSL
ncbi:hypothetical protein [Acidovorax soli]|nr:hypothetical protein [Acidovorax soli]